MKKLRIFLPMIIICLCAIACKQKDTMSTMEKIQKSLNEMQNYECTATLTRISNKGENTYETKQYYKSTGEYKMELLSPENVAGNYTIFDGKTICQYNPRVNGKVIIDVPESQQRNQLFLGAFIKNYMQSEDVSIETAKFDEGKCTILEAVIPGENKYLATEKLWVDNESLKPKQLIIYDKENKERYIVLYNEFDYNVSLDENIFKIEKQ